MQPMECGVLDVSCHSANALGMAIFAVGEAFAGLGWALISRSFNQEAGTISAAEWNVATGMASKWALLLLIVVVIVGTIRVAFAMFQRNTQAAISAVLWTFFAWPVTLMAIWASITITNATDNLTAGILHSGQSDVNAALRGIFNTTLEISTSGAEGNEAVSFIASCVIAALLMFGAFLSSIVLALMLAFRSFALLVLIGFAPVAFMAMPMESLRGWVRTWMQAVIALIVAKPLAAGILVMTHSIFASANDLWGWLTGIVGMTMAAFAPVITMGLFQWADGQTAANYGSHSSAVASNSVRGVTRVAAAPIRK